MASLLVLLPLPSWAGQWSVSFTGTIQAPGDSAGNYTFANSQVTGPAPYNADSHPCFTFTSNNCALSIPSSGYANLTVTATLTWVHNAQGDTSTPPATVDVLETGYADTEHYWKNATGIKTDADDGLGLSDPVTHPASPTSGSTCTGSLLQRLTVPAGQLSVMLPQRILTASLSYATADPGGSGGRAVNYTVSVDSRDATLNLTGPTPDSSGGLNILVGQGCSAALVTTGFPNGSMTTNYRWTVSGITFQDWEPATPQIGTTSANPQASYFVGGSGPLTNPSAHWYWNDPNQMTETISCTATVTPPAGQGSALSVTASIKVSVQLPTFTATGTGGYMQVNTKAPKDPNYEVWAGPTFPTVDNQLSGMSWKASVFTPSTPSFGTGSLELVQLVTPNESWITNDSPPQPGNASDNNITQLDGSCPYGAVVAESSQPMLDGDNPGIPLTSGSTTIRTSATDKDSFIDYLLYMPPVPANTDRIFPPCRWITLAQFAWSIDGSAAIPGTGNWADYVKQNGSDAAIPATVTPSSTTPFAGIMGPDFFPAWTRVSP